jgi:two-component system, sensor histidine kinase PdtaS
MRKPFILALAVVTSCCSLAQNSSETVFTVKDAGSPLQLIREAATVGKTDTAAANRLFGKIIDEATLRKDDYVAGMAYYEMAEMNSRYNNHNKTFGGYFNARILVEKTGAEKELAYIYYGLGREQYYRGAFNQSVNLVSYCIMTARKHGLEQLESDALEYLALMYHEIPYYEMKSSPYLLKSLQIKEKLKDKKGMVQLLPKISKVYLGEKKYDSALYYANAALKLAAWSGRGDAVIMARLVRADILILLKQLTAAAAELDTIQQGVYASFDPNLIISFNTTKGSYYLEAGDEKMAKQQYDSAMKRAGRKGTLETLFIIYRDMADAYARHSDFTKAYQFQTEYNKLFVQLYNPSNASKFEGSALLIEDARARDEIKHLTAINEVRQLKLQRELDMRRGLERENALMDSIISQQKKLGIAITAEQELLERENNYKTSQLENEKRLRNAEAAKLTDERRLRLTLLIGLGMALLMGSLILHLYNRQKRKNSIIEKQSGELQTLMKEIHHRVKNNLQVVSSLLNLQSRYIKDEEAVEAVKDSRNRVLSMALIHQSLYQEDDLKAMNVEDYIEKLSGSLFASYNISPDKIKLIRDIEPLSLSLDVLVPVGLILNELITNSLKYAFPDERTGTVTIILKQEQNILKLRVYDDGKGIPDGFTADNKTSFGFKMIHSFLQKLKGEMHIYPDNGTKAEIDIHHYKLNTL